MTLFATVTNTGDGSNRLFSVPFGYLDPTHIHLLYDGVEQPYSSFVFLSVGQIQTTTAPANGVQVTRKRSTPADISVAHFTAGSFNPDDLNAAILQTLYVSQEVLDAAVNLTALNAAIAALGTFNKTYFGVLAADPSVTPIDGSALVLGAYYFNSGSHIYRYWNGTAWSAIPYATVADGSLAETKYGTGTVSARALADLAVDEAALQTGAVSTRALAAAGVTLAKLGADVTAPAVVTKPMNPFNVTQHGHVLPFLDESVYWVAPQVAFENQRDNPLFDGGVTQFAFQSVSTSTLSQNITGLTGTTPYGTGATSIIVIDPTNFAANKTLAIQLDDGTVYVGKITSVVSNTVTFTPAFVAGQVATPDGSVRQVATSRAAKLVGNYGAGSTLLQCTTVMGVAGTGEVVRVQLDNGNTFRSTVAAYDTTNNLITMADAIPGGNAASNGNFIYVGPHDVDPNLVISRRGSAAIAGDFGAAFQLTGPDFNSQNSVSAQMFQMYTQWVEPNPASGYKCIVNFGTIDPTHTSGTTRDVLSMGQGVFFPGLSDPGYGKFNFGGVGVNNGSQMIVNQHATATLTFGAITGGSTGTLNISVAGAQAGDIIDLAVAPSALPTGIIYTPYISSPGVVSIRAYNCTGGGITVSAGQFDVAVRRFA